MESQVAAVYPRYQGLLEAAGALDFDDLLFRTVELFQQSDEARARYRQRFDHVLVDEYQDTNRAQYLLLRELVEETRHITAVGDPDQSVYSWRGADIRNILEFQRDYPDALVIPAGAKLPEHQGDPGSRPGGHQGEFGASREESLDRRSRRDGGGGGPALRRAGGGGRGCARGAPTGRPRRRRFRRHRSSLSDQRSIQGPGGDPAAGWNALPVGGRSSLLPAT